MYIGGRVCGVTISTANQVKQRGDAEVLNNIMDKETARVAPLLVRLYNTHRVYSLAKDKGTPARSELADIVLEMFETQLSPREAELVTDVLLGLLQQAE